VKDVFHFHNSEVAGWGSTWCGAEVEIGGQDTDLPVCPRCYVIEQCWGAYRAALRYYGAEADRREAVEVVKR
jgi:hypothetical protein